MSAMTCSACCARWPNGPTPTDGDGVRGLLAESWHHPEMIKMVQARFIEPAEAQAMEVLRRGWSEARFGRRR